MQDLEFIGFGATVSVTVSHFRNRSGSLNTSKCKILPQTYASRCQHGS